MEDQGRGDGRNLKKIGGKGKTHLPPSRHSRKDRRTVVKVVISLDVRPQLEPNVLDVLELALDEFPLLCGKVIRAVCTEWREGQLGTETMKDEQKRTKGTVEDPVPDSSFFQDPKLDVLRDDAAIVLRPVVVLRAVHGGVPLLVRRGVSGRSEGEGEGRDVRDRDGAKGCCRACETPSRAGGHRRQRRGRRGARRSCGSGWSVPRSERRSNVVEIEFVGIRAE